MIPGRNGELACANKDSGAILNEPVPVRIVHGIWSRDKRDRLLSKHSNTFRCFGRARDAPVALLQDLSETSESRCIAQLLRHLMGASFFQRDDDLSFLVL